MMALSDRMLGGTGGCAKVIAAVHAETITVLNGADAGRTFQAVNEIESDLVLDSELGADPRGKRMLRFEGTPPALASQDIIRTADGKRWHAVRRPGGAYLTTDFELREITAGLDT